MQTATGAFQLSYGDGTGDSSSDRRTFSGPTGFTQANTIYHVVAMARGRTDGEIWVNGAKLSVTTSGSGGAIAYGSDPARIGSQGGFSGFSTGFNGRIYLVTLYRRSFTPREVHVRARGRIGSSVDRWRRRAPLRAPCRRLRATAARARSSSRSPVDGFPAHGSSWTPAMVRRWHADPFGFLRPWDEVPALIGSAPPPNTPSTGTGVVTFLMG